MIDIPSRLAVAASDSNDVSTWLTGLPAALQMLLRQHNCRRWEQIKSDWSITLRAYSDTGEILYVKAGPPNHETTSAITSLLGNNHPQLVRCIDSDIITGTHVLANVEGVPCSPHERDDRYLAEIGKLLKELHSLNQDSRMINLTSWCNDLLDVPDYFPETILNNVSRCAMLLDSAETAAWLHGDLHHANIIRSDTSGLLVAIDPKGICGDASFDICTFIRNHVPTDLDDSSLRAFLENRIRVIAAAAGYPLDRAFGWAAAGNALSLMWDLPVSGDLSTDEHRHLNRILMHLNALAEDNGTP
ncbi:MAG: aminoglycoside phosphotransferase family protein [Armatimonadota bacterium]